MSDAITRAIDDQTLDKIIEAVNKNRNRVDGTQQARIEIHAALLALIDPERIARLEMVALAAQNMLAEGPYEKARTWLTTALAALDAQRAPDAAPGEG